MRCYIIDDERHAIDTLTRYIDKVPELSVAGSATSSLKALQTLRTIERPDIIFLDIDMPELSGLETLPHLPEQSAVIFTTAFSKYAVNAFDHNAKDFLLKPFSFSRFLQAVRKAEVHLIKPPITNVTDPASSIFINPGVRGKVVQIHLEDILYVEGLKNYIMIYSVHGAKHITYLTMTEIGAALPEQQFIRIHKSFIVNLAKLKIIEGNQITLIEHTVLPLGVKYREALFNHISKATLKSNRKT